MVALVALVIGVPRFAIGVGLGDEGLLAYGAMQVWDGQVPNRDFVSLQPPLSFYALAGAFAAFSPSLVVLRALGLALHVAIGVATYGVARGVARPPAALAAAIAMLLLGVPLHNFVPAAVWWGTLFALCALGAWMRAIPEAGDGSAGVRPVAAAVAGGATALTLASRHDQGVYVVLASLIALVVVLRRLPGVRWAPLVRGWLAGAGGVAVPLLVYWGACGALPEMVSQLVVFPLATYVATSALPWPRFDAGASVAHNLVTVLYYLPPVTALLAVLRVTATRGRRFGVTDARVVLLAAATALFSLQVVTRSDVFHLVITLAPALCLAAWGIEQLAFAAGRRARGARAVVACAAVALALAWFWPVRGVFLKSPAGDARPLALDRGGSLLPKREAERLERLVAELRARAPDDASILVLPYQPMLYFLADRRNPTRWNYLWPGDQTAEDHAELVRQAQADPPAVVALASPGRMNAYAADILGWVDRGYEPVTQIGDVLLLRPRTASGRRVPDRPEAAGRVP